MPRRFFPRDYFRSEERTTSEFLSSMATICSPSSQFFQYFSLVLLLLLSILEPSVLRSLFSTFVLHHRSTKSPLYLFRHLPFNERHLRMFSSTRNLWARFFAVAFSRIARRREREREVLILRWERCARRVSLPPSLGNCFDLKMIIRRSLPTPFDACVHMSLAFVFCLRFTLLPLSLLTKNCAHTSASYVFETRARATRRSSSSSSSLTDMFSNHTNTLAVCVERRQPERTKDVKKSWLLNMYNEEEENVVLISFSLLLLLLRGYIQEREKRPLKM